MGARRTTIHHMTYRRIVIKSILTWSTGNCSSRLIGRIYDTAVQEWRSGGSDATPTTRPWSTNSVTSNFKFCWPVVISKERPACGVFWRWNALWEWKNENYIELCPSYWRFFSHKRQRTVTLNVKSCYCLRDWVPLTWASMDASWLQTSSTMAALGNESLNILKNRKERKNTVHHRKTK